MLEISQEKDIPKENQNQNSLSIKPTEEKNIPKSFQSEATFPNSIDSKEILQNSSKSKNKENISQQQTLNNFFKNNSTNNNNTNNNINTNNNNDLKENQTPIAIQEEKIKKEIYNDFNKEENKKNLEKIENLFLNKKRLIKKSDVILKHKILKKIAKNYFDKEAELGSDNEEHDDLIKKVYHSDSDSEKENDLNAKDVDNLIDNEEKENHVQNEKYFDDMLEKDHDEILKVIEGPKKRIIKEAPKKLVIEDKGLSLKIRMERLNDMNMLREEEDENNEEYKFKNIENKLKELKNQYNEDEMNEELKEMIEINNNKLIKQINIMTGQQNKSFKQHLEENKEILKNVIQNDEEDSSKKNEKKNEIIVKGNGAAKLGNKKFRPFCGMGNFGNCKNSLLNHIKKEKNGNSNNLSEKVNIKQRSTTSFHSNFKLNNDNQNRYAYSLNDMLIKK